MGEEQDEILIEIVDDPTDDVSLKWTVSCWYCHGLGTVDGVADCPVCEGTGSLEG